MYTVLGRLLRTAWRRCAEGVYERRCQRRWILSLAAGLFSHAAYESGGWPGVDYAAEYGPKIPPINGIRELILSTTARAALPRLLVTSKVERE